MGNFVVVHPTLAAPEAASKLLQKSLKIATKLGWQPPLQVRESNSGSAATFPRWNGSGSAIAVDEGTGDWLFSAGTWFHSSGLSSGQEQGLLEKYQECGIERLARDLEGFFVIVIGQGRSRSVHAITDLVGSCHAFLSQTPEGILLSGSSLLLAGATGPEMDDVACQEFLNLGVIYEDRTLYKKVRKLKPASIYRFENGAVTSCVQYWSATQLNLESYDGKRGAERLWTTLCSAAERIEKIYPNLICDLTGGYDSRALVAGFIGGGFTPSTAVSGPVLSGDVRVSRELAKSAGLEHRHTDAGSETRKIRIEDLRRALQITDGEYDLVEYHRILLIHSKLSSEFDASCNGSFGEVARGYWWELLWPERGARKPLNAEAIARLRFVTTKHTPTLFAAARRVELVGHMSEVIQRTGGAMQGIPNTSLMDQVYLGMRMQRWQGRIASSTNQIWPCLSPFMLKPVLEAMLETQNRARARSLLIRGMLQRFSPAWARIPLEHGYPAEPATWSNIHRFYPLAKYYGRKVIDRISSKTGIRLARGRSDEESQSPMEQLRKTEEIRELLNPGVMRAACVLDEQGLETFLRKSEGKSLEYEQQWSRLLSLELGLEFLGSLSKDGLGY